MDFKIPATAFTLPIPITPEDKTLPKFKFSDVTRKEDLGHGSFGSTYKALYQGKTVAVKQLHNNTWDETGKKFLKEATIMNTLRHDKIVEFWVYRTLHWQSCWNMHASTLSLSGET